MSRIKELLLKCADNLDKMSDPLNSDFVNTESITAEEMTLLSEQMAAYIRGCARAPQDLAAKILVYAVVNDDKKSGAIVGRFEEFVRAAQLKKKMNITSILLLCLLSLTGCTYNYGVAGRCGPPLNLPHTGYSVVNNSGHILDIYQDGQCIARNLGPGDVLPVRPIIFQRRSNVVAIGRAMNGDYEGMDHWTFVSGLPEAWPVGKLYRPGTTPPVWMQ